MQIISVQIGIGVVDADITEGAPTAGNGTAKQFPGLGSLHRQVRRNQIKAGVEIIPSRAGTNKTGV